MLIMEIVFPTATTTDGDILRYAHRLEIPHFRGVKMRDELTKTKAVF